MAKTIVSEQPSAEPLNGRTIAGEYLRLESLRVSYLDRARACAELTIPSLFPQSGHTATSTFITPYQSLGSRGTTNLSAKLLQALFPPHTPFFKFQPDEALIDQAEQVDRMMEEQGQQQAGQEQVRGQFAKIYTEMERIVLDWFETKAYRVKLFEAFKQLIVGGNSLLHIDTEGNLRVFRLDQYVVRRDPSGNLLDVITCETVALDVLPLDMQELVKADQKQQVSPDNTVKVYTRCQLVGGKWEVSQAVEEHEYAGGSGSYPQDRCPYIAARWTAIPNEDYGRGLVEEHYGDIANYERLSKSITQAAQAAAKILFLVNPNGVTRAAKLSKTPNLGFANGRRDDIGVLQVDKYADMKVAFEAGSDVKQRVEHVFLLHSAVQRNAERVTAEEVRVAARELETAHGGVYGVFAEELQKPLLNVIVNRLRADSKLPDMGDTYRVVLVAGLQALGRSSDRDKLLAVVQMVQGNPELAGLFDMREVMKRILVNDGIDTDGILKSKAVLDAERQAAQEAQQQQAMTDIAGKAAGPVLGSVVKSQMEGGEPPQ